MHLRPYSQGFILCGQSTAELLTLPKHPPPQAGQHDQATDGTQRDRERVQSTLTERPSLAPNVLLAHAFIAMPTEATRAF